MRILFVCFGNSCRSQMAEGFAKALARGIWEVDSAGLLPARDVAHLAREVMREKGISLEGHYPKSVDELPLAGYDLIVNMSGEPLPGRVTAPVLEWDIPDPIGQSVDVYRCVRDEIERRVRELLDRGPGARP
ncbi:MAG TPA: arsenate reductase ArsC [Bryobacteraceae bacterium]|nr:arsenate reductase ArsC [Bryobacteraceae bacterium]